MGSVATIARSASPTESPVRNRRVLSRQRILCSDRLYNVCCHDREIFVVTDFSRTPVVTEFSLSQQSLHSPMSRQSFMCRDRAWGWEGRGVRSRDREQCEHDSAQ